MKPIKFLLIPCMIVLLFTSVALAQNTKVILIVPNTEGFEEVSFGNHEVGSSDFQIALHQALEGATTLSIPGLVRYHVKLVEVAECSTVLTSVDQLGNTWTVTFIPEFGDVSMIYSTTVTLASDPGSLSMTIEIPGQPFTRNSRLMDRDGNVISGKFEELHLRGLDSGECMLITLRQGEVVFHVQSILVP